MPFDIATGTYTEADPVQPLLTSGSGIEALAEVTPVAATPSPLDQTPAADITGQQQERDAAGLAAASAAMNTGMDARTSMVHGYEQALLPLGSSPYQMDLPIVPEQAMPPGQSFLYPSPRDQPTLAELGGWDPGYEAHGNEPGPVA